MIVGLDVGTSCMKIAVGKCGEKGRLNLIGSHTVAARGIVQGEVADHAAASACILQALQETENVFKMEIGEVELAVTGGHIESSNRHGTARIRDATHVINKEDVRNALDDAHPKELEKPGAFVLHAIPQQFRVDGKVVRNPVGLSGSELEVDAHCIYGLSDRLQKTINCLSANSRVYVRVNNRLFSGLVSALAVLSEDDKDQGVIVLDVGAGTTEYVFYTRGVIQQSGVLMMNGEGGISDMSKLLRIIHARIGARKLECLAGRGVFLTGGCARRPDLMELTRSIFGIPVRVAVPQGFDGPLEHLAQPEMSTVIGLIKYRVGSKA